MLSLEEFTYLINKYQGYTEFQDKLYDLGIDTINNEWVDFTYKMIRKYMEVYFTDLGWDTIEWWIEEPDNRVIYFTDLGIMVFSFLPLYFIRYLSLKIT